MGELITRNCPLPVPRLALSSPARRDDVYVAWKLGAEIRCDSFGALPVASLLVEADQFEPRSGVEFGSSAGAVEEIRCFRPFFFGDCNVCEPHKGRYVRCIFCEKIAVNCFGVFDTPGSHIQLSQLPCRRSKPRVAR